MAIFEGADNTIILTDENGNEISFEFLDLIEYEGGEYVVLFPMDGEDEEDEVVILQVKESEDDSETETYSGVDSEETLQAVFEIFREKFKDEINFAD